MALKLFEENVSIHQTMGDNPNTDNGLSAQELKARFDLAAELIKQYLNEHVVPAVNGKIDTILVPVAIDPTMSKEGYAADAKGVGTALAGKAPAGYGLGEDIPGLTDLDAVTKSGNYKGSILLSGMHAVITVWCRADMSSPNYGTQHLYSELNGGMELYRTKKNGVWGELEYVNPPMLLGVEYRTTERHNGKVVYAKAFDFGALPNATEKQVEFCAEGATAVCDLKLHLSDGYLLSSGYGIDKMSQISNGINLGNTPTKVRVHAEGNYSNLTAYATIKYTKD